MTLDAFSKGYTLWYLARRAQDADELKDDLNLSEYDADSVHDHLGRVV